MKVEYLVYYKDGGEEFISVEKPSGAHPDSPRALHKAISDAENGNKIVNKVARTTIFRGLPIELFSMTREQVMQECRNSCSFFAVHGKWENE